MNPVIPRAPVPCLRRRQLLALAAGAPLAGCSGRGGTLRDESAVADHPAAMRMLLRSVAADLGGYQFRATPIGNFGVGSIYLDDVTGSGTAGAESRWYLGGPDQWLAPGRPEVERRRARERLVAEGTMGSVQLDSTQSREVNAQLGLGLLAALVGSAGMDLKRGVQARFSAQEVRNRRLNWAEFEAARRAGRIAPEVAQAVVGGRFVIVAADLVVTGYQAEFVVDEASNPRLAASLRSNLLLPRARSASIGFNMSESAQGRYLASAQQPVVAAVLFKRPPPAFKAFDGGGTPPDLQSWPAAQVNATSLQRLEGLLLGTAP